MSAGKTAMLLQRVSREPSSKTPLQSEGVRSLGRSLNLLTRSWRTMNRSKQSSNNLSGLDPRGRAVLVQMRDLAPVQSSRIAIPDIVRDKTEMVEQRAVVVAVGASCWKDEGFYEPLLWGLWRRWVVIPRAKVGDEVLVTKFAGYMTRGPADGKRYRLVNDKDIFCAITKAQKAVEETQEQNMMGVAHG